MRKLFSILTVLLIVAGCSSQPEPTFKGKLYQLREAQNNAVITLGFAADEPRFYGKVVNNFFGSYTFDGAAITFGPAGATMMMGPEPLMEAEQNFLGILPRIKSFKMDGKNLILITDNGQELVFDEIPQPAPDQQ